MKSIEVKLYHIDEHPNKELCFKYIRESDHTIGEFELEDVVSSLKELSKLIGGELDYSISTSPARGEFISFTNYDKDLLMKLVPNECPLTGTHWDISLIEGLQNRDSLKVLRELHFEVEYLYSDEGLHRICVDNDYYFDESGVIW